MKKIFFITISLCVIAFSVISVSAASAPYTTFDDAAAAIELTPLHKNVVQDSIDGSTSFANEEGYNLFDNDTATKFCTGTFPLYASWKMDKAYSIGGLIVATANDNVSNNGRNPDTWTVSGSKDGNTWTVIYSGTAADLEETNFTYYIVKFDASDAYEYFKLDCPSTVANCFQMSELVLCEAEAPVVEEIIEEPVVEETTPAVEPEAPAPVIVTAPQTSDSLFMTAVIAIIALAGCVVLKKKIN